MLDMRIGLSVSQASRGSIHPLPIAAIFSVFSEFQHAMERKNGSVTVRP
jgi:hypothetical protein